MDAFSMIISLFGGLGLFLYGMHIMGDGLENAAGDKMKFFFEKLTSNPILGVMTGAIVTATIQSSSATTVMVVGFVNAGLMNLYQAAAVIMGANIGTTITAKLVTLNISDFIPIFLGIGAVMCLFAKKDKLKQIGAIVLGFGILFLGMDIMKDAMAPLKESQFFIDYIATLKGNMLLGILTGLVMTAVVQSSSATTAIVITLSSTGLINLEVALPVIFGCNIGTCVTALISSIGTSKTARKAAIIHLLFNLTGTIIFIPLMGILITVVEKITPGGADLAKRQIANAHVIFNFANTIVLLPTIGILVKIVNKLIPGEDKVEEISTKYIDERLLETPAIAIGQSNKEIIRMANVVEDSLDNSIKAFENYDDSLIKNVYDREKLVNLLEDEITRYLVKISKLELASHQTDVVTSLFYVVNDLERIGDHAENIAELSSEAMQKKLKFSDDAIKELDEMYGYVKQSLKLSVESLEEMDASKATKVIEIEENIDRLEKELRGNHIKRLNKGLCNATVGAIFLDLISNLERIGDHATNIAQTTLSLQ